MLCPINKFTDAFDLRENGIGGGSPEERSLVFIIMLHVLLDFGYQFTNVAEGAAANRLLGDEPEPTLHLVEPA